MADATTDVRDAQLARVVARSVASNANKCATCGLLHRFCACSSPAWQISRQQLSSCRIALTTILHSRELGRGTSTHRLLGHIFPDADTYTVKRRGDGYWGHIEALCAVDGRTPFVLFPSATAVPVRDACAGLPRDRIRLIVLDGHWAEASRLASIVPPTVQFVALSPTEQGPSLFQACRTQPAEGKLCTAEAVGCALDEIYGSSVSGNAIRAALRTFVDSHVRQLHLIGLGPHKRGAGYRTWTLGPSAGALGNLPVYLIERIADFAGDAVAPSGYRPRDRWTDVAHCDGSIRVPAADALPPPSIFTRGALAQTSRALYFFAAGSCLEHGSRVKMRK